MRSIVSLILALCLPVCGQPDQAAELESLVAGAQQAQSRADFAGAADAYRQALAIRPDLPQLWSNLGLVLYESHEYSKSEESLRRAIGINNSLFVPNLFLGLDLLELKRPREAVAYLLTAEKLNPKDAQTLLALGRAYHFLLDPARSQQWYQRSVDLSPRSGEAWYGLGQTYLDLAESASAKLTNAFAQSVYVTELTAEAFADQGLLTEATQAYRALLASSETPPRCSRTSYGLVLLRQGEHAQAQEQFERDLASCPTAETAKAQLSSGAGGASPSAIRRGSGSRSASALEHPLPAFGKMTEHELQQFASDMFFSDDFRAAALAADRLQKQYPNHPSGYYWAVRAYQKLAIAALARAGEVEPESARMHALLGDAYQRQKMLHEAQEEYSKMLALEPGSIAGLTGLAAAYLADGQLAMAEATGQKALARDPTDSEINLLMAEIFLAQHKDTEAEPCLERSLNVRPNLRPRVHALRGRVFARTGRPKEAITELTQGLASDEDGSVYYQLARIYQSSGDAKAAAAAFEKSQQIRTRRTAIAQKNLAPVP